jgi:hypothetical protein
VVAGPAGRGDRRLEQLDQIVPGRPLVVGHLGPQPQRPRQQLRPLGVRGEPAGFLGGAQQRGQRLGRIACLLPVEGDLGGVPIGRDQPGIGFQRLSHCAVQPSPFHR